MSEHASWIDGGATGAEALGKMWGKFFTPGTAIVTNTASHQVTQRGAGANMSVDIAAGAGLTDLTDYSIPVWSDATVNKTVTAADPTNPRKDIVVRYVDLTAYATNNNLSALKFIIVSGTPAGSPSDPSDPTIQAAVGSGNPWEKLARITLPASAPSVITAYITDLRVSIAYAGNLWGGSNNTNGHSVPNVADDTVALLSAAQSLTNKTLDGTTNKVTAGGANSTLRDANGIQIDEELQRTEHEFNYVGSGCVWSGDSYGSTLNASMTSGVVYIAGRRLTVSAVTSRAFTASKDTYVDFADNGDGTAKIIYTEVTNNAASPSTLSNSSTFTDAANIRNAIIVTGAGNIASAGSVNQGQESKVLPIASSIPYAVTDSLGNMICCLDSKRRMLGARQIVTSQGSIGAGATDITGLNTTVVVPANRKVRISCYGQGFQGSSSATATLDILQDGTVIQSEIAFVGTATGQIPIVLSRMLSPSTGSHTYKIQGRIASGTGTFSASSTQPGQLVVELI